MENNELNLINEELIEQPKFHYEPTFEATEQIPVYDENGNQMGTEMRVTGRILKKVWTDEEELKKQRRNERKHLLDAFDKWEKAVLRGREFDDEKVMTWYQLLLDLEETAFESIPPRVRYYLKNIDEEN